MPWTHPTTSPSPSKARSVPRTRTDGSVIKSSGEVARLARGGNVSQQQLALSSLDGAKVYSPWLLAVYDWLVLGINARLLWRCRASRVLGLYDRHISDNHLDIGVGTGYFLHHCRSLGAKSRVCLYDLNPNSLRHTANRIARYQPEYYLGDVLQALPFADERFQSVGMSALLHCLPGNFAAKAIAFDNVARCMRPGAVLFGATVVNVPAQMHAWARSVLGDLNRKGIFSNLEDTPDALEQELNKRFVDVRVELEGCVAVFSARKPER